MRVRSPLPLLLETGSWLLAAFWVVFVGCGWLVFVVWVLGFYLCVLVSGFFAGVHSEVRRLWRARA